MSLGSSRQSLSSVKAAIQNDYDLGLLLTAIAAHRLSGQGFDHPAQDLWPWAALACMLAVSLPSPLQAPGDGLAKAVVHDGGRCAAAAGAHCVEGTNASLGRTLKEGAAQDAWQEGRCSLKVEGLRHCFARCSAAFGLGLVTRCC